MKERQMCSLGPLKVEGEDSMLRRVHPKKRSVSWVNSVPRQFLPNGSFLLAPDLLSTALIEDLSGKNL